MFGELVAANLNKALQTGNRRPSFQMALVAVGSMFADLKRAYPDLRLLMGEGQQFAFIEAESLSFGLDAYPEAPSNRSKVTSVLMLR